MKPYKRISNAALTLLVAGALTTGGVSINHTNIPATQISSTLDSASDTENTNFDLGGDSIQR